MKRLLIVLTLFVMSDQLLAGISIFKGTDTQGFGVGKSGISTSKQETGGSPPSAGDSLILETGDYLLLESGDKLLLE